jgi:hypothetical protein
MTIRDHLHEVFEQGRKSERLLCALVAETFCTSGGVHPGGNGDCHYCRVASAIRGTTEIANPAPVTRSEAQEQETTREG